MIKKAIGSALLLMSALAVSAPAMAQAPVKETKEKSDSIFSARKVFENIHLSALEILPKTTRLDMLDYWDADSVYKASNVMDGLSWIEELTETYMKVRITSVSTLEIKILPAAKSKLALTIYTVGDEVQAQDSRLQFFDENLQEVPLDKHFVMPQVKDFFAIPKGSATKMKEIEAMIPFPTMAFNANPKNNNLEAVLTVEKYINQDDWNIAKLFAKPSITLEWKKEKYKY